MRRTVNLMIGELVEKDFRLRSTNANRSIDHSKRESVALKTCVFEVMAHFNSLTELEKGPASWTLINARPSSKMR
jgi:hypothetical protein